MLEYWRFEYWRFEYWRFGYWRLEYWKPEYWRLTVASIRRQRDRYEIRECVTTERGPRQRVLARFDRILSPGVIDEAAARATRPFDRRALAARARARGIAVSDDRRSGEARSLLAALRRGQPVRPSIVGLLREALAGLESHELPQHLEPAAEWLGANEAARGRALRGLLRTASRVARSRGEQRTPPERAFPVFSSAREAE